MSELISDFNSCAQRKNELEDVFADGLQIMLRKIIAQKPSFTVEANKQLKQQYAHKLFDQYYAAIACSALQTSDHMESFTWFHSHLALTLGSQSKSGKISCQATSLEVLKSPFQ